MKRILLNFAVAAGILSWIVLLFLFLLLLFPNSVVKTIDQYAIPSYSIEFSKLQNSGNVLNQNLQFFDFHIMKNDKSVLKLKELFLGFSFKPQYIFQPIRINAIAIEEGYLIQSDFMNSNSSQLFVSLNETFLISFKNFKFQKNDSIFEINGDLFGSLSSSISGQLSFLHDNQLSTIALDSFDDSYRISLNLHSYNWLSLIPAYTERSLQDFAFEINALGQFQNDQSIVKGSFKSNSIFLESLSIKPNQGSFYFQIQKDIGTLSLTEFLHPLVDEEYPIQINLQNKSIGIPRFSLSDEFFEEGTLPLTNLSIKNLFISLEGILPKFSGFISDLDLKDLYFEEILNLSGDFSGYGYNTKFLIDSETSIIKNYKKNAIHASVSGMTKFDGSALDLKARIKNQSSAIDLALQVNPASIRPLSIIFKGRDIPKSLVTFSIPISLQGLSPFIDTSVILEEKNSIYFEYSSPSSESKAILKAKILLNESKLALSNGFTADLSLPIIETDAEHLYIFSPSGKVSTLSHNGVYGLLNYNTQKLTLHSTHDIESNDAKKFLSLENNNLNLPYMQVEHRGELNLVSLKLSNAVSIKTKDFYIPIVESHKIYFNKANIYIVNLDKIYGLLPSAYMNKEFSTLLSGINLIKKYDLTFSTNINLELSDFIPDSDYLQISGNDFFDMDLLIQKNTPPIFKINSDLKNIELNSYLNVLSKNKLEKLPTEIMITNLSSPSLTVSNKQIDMHIRNLSDYDGYISIGKRLPAQFKNFKKDSGLNVYLYSEFISENLLNASFSKFSESTSIKFNQLAFDIKKLKLFSNSFADLNGLIELKNSEIIGNLIADKLNVKLRMDSSGFLRIEIKDSTIPDINFINSAQSSLDTALNSRIIVRNSSFDKLKIKNLDVYLLNNKNNFTANNLKLSSNLISIKPFKESSNAYFSIDKNEPIYKIRGDFLIKDSNKIPYLKDFADFSYFNGSLNLQWRELSTLSHIEGETNFILKDLLLKDSISDSLALNLLGVLNLRNILGKLANLDLSIDEFTATKLGRVEGDLLFSKSKMRLTSPLFIETNAAKMRWVGQIDKNSKNNLNDLDLNLDLRIRIGENLPWYAAILGGIPAVAGSAVINELFEEDINNLTNYQYEIFGTISEPKLERIKQEIK